LSDGGYLLGNEADATEERLGALSAIFDPVTFRHVVALGIGPGWRCWEVGAGGPTVTRWLANQVGATGSVLATDLDISPALPASAPNVEVRRHDVGREAPPGHEFDLVHSRLVLVHVTERQAALRSMVSALRPGGWLLVEDADPALQPLSCLEADGPEEELANRVRGGFRALMAARGVDLAYGRKLPRLLREAGLADVAADAWFPVALPECARLELATLQMIRRQIIDAGIATDVEVDRHSANVATGRLDLAQPPLISAWGQKP
jgi:SAM-dependent methyltransferase